MRRDKDPFSRSWHISGRRSGNFRDDLAIFLQELAVGGGLIAVVSDVLPADGCLTPETFADGVLRAEGWDDPTDEYTFRPQLMRLFVERYGASVYAADYQRPTG
ncbi:MAG TPA: hypothetical protein VFZ35_01545 [Sphingomicrobium sp.]